MEIDHLPKSAKKFLRYIKQDIYELEKLKEVEEAFKYAILKRKKELENEITNKEA